MKIKKLLSFITAAAISASCFVGMAVSASAKTISNASVDTIYKAADLCEKTSTNDTMDFDSTKADAYAAIGAPFGDSSSFTPTNYPAVAQNADANATLTYNIETAGTYTFSMLVLEYNNRYPVVTLDNGETPVLDGSTLTGQPKYGNGFGRQYTILQVGLKLTEGKHTISWVPASGRIQGLFAVVLHMNTQSNVPATGISISAQNINTANLILKPNGTVQLTANVTPANSTSEVVWNSDADSVATVSNGKVTAVSSGTAKITATAGDYSATSIIEVLAPSEPASTSTVYAKINCTNETVGGNTCNVSTIHKFMDEADEEAKAVFADTTYGTVIDNDFLKNYVNFIVGTSNETTYAKPSFKLSVPKGSFKMYFVGRSNATDKLSAAINGKTTGIFTRKADFAKGADLNGNSVKILDLYVLEFTTSEALTDAVVTFDTDKSWLPDMYAVAVAGTEAPTTINGTVEEAGTFTGEGYEGSAKAFTVSFAPAGKTITSVKVASKADSAEKAVNITTNGGIVFGIITSNIDATADSYVVTATID